MEVTRMRRTGESLDLEINNETHWQDVKERAAIAAMQGMLANPHGFLSKDSACYNARTAITHANALIEELKKEYEQILADSAKTCKDEQEQAERIASKFKDGCLYYKSQVKKSANSEHKNETCKEKDDSLTGETIKRQQVTFTCINKQVSMSVQELIEYYINNECVNTAEECAF